MKIKKFYQISRCEHIAAYDNLLFEEGRYTVLSNGIKMFATLLATDMDKGVILNQVYAFLQKEYASLKMNFSWESTVYAEDDVRKFRRLLIRLASLTVVKANVATCFQVPEKLADGSDYLEGFVHLILQDEKEQYHAMIIHGGTCKRSMKGRSAQTSSSMDLEALLAKWSLEESYPGITIHSVYLTHKDDMPGKTLPDMEITGTAASNMHSLDYKAFYDANNQFDEEAFSRTICEAMVSEEKSCYGCYYASVCKTESLTIDSASQTFVESGYRVPSYTEEQMAAVRHKDGPMLVCAGPGSGKTATIIGRIKYLVEECNITPQFILVVTFTNKAAQELRERCLSFLKEENLPCIATLNAFAYRILHENQEELGKDLKLLTDGEQLRLIENICNVLPHLSGFKTENVYGNNGLYKTIQRKLNQFLKMTEYEFFQKNPDLGADFVSFASIYKEIIECNDYISFDEQISLSNVLFEQNPDILSIYQSIYKYVMVDEYQDVNEEQVKMLYHIAEHGNIMVVGDDDQNIFGFRGASADYMRDFPNHFPGAETVVLKDNFRSTKALVSAAQSLINNNQKRIQKDIRSGSDVDGVKPVVIKSMDISALSSLIEELIGSGYHYDDIAILAFKNSPLETLHGALEAPTILAKSYLRNDGLFTLAHSILRLHRNLNDDTAFLQLASLFGKRHLLKRVNGLSLYESVVREYGIEEGSVFAEELSLLKDVFALLDNTTDVRTFLSMCAYRIAWSGSDSVEVILEQVEKQKLSDTLALLAFMDAVVNFEDGLRVEVDTTGKITLITCHDAKGKEFPVVILWNDFSSKDEESRRLFYVAVTRSKERLYVMQEVSCKADFLDELPHEERGCA